MAGFNAAKVACGILSESGKVSLMILERPRRNRNSAVSRELMQETTLSPAQLIYPVFVCEGKNARVPILSLPGVERVSIDELIQDVKQGLRMGVKAFALFPVIEEAKKDPYARESANKDGLLQRALREIKSAAPEALLISDVAMDPYSTDGHDGLVREGKILNDETLPILAEMALAQAEAGADWVAPSDMMDGRIGFLREALDESGFQDRSILAYTAKYASSFYGPFREALDSAPKAGDKKTYQMDPCNRREALREARLDIREGADIIMVKPALSYLDVISDLKQNTDVPVAAYQVSGEYAMLKAASERGWLDEARAFQETLLSIRRAGADMILTYYALQYAKQF